MRHALILVLSALNLAACQPVGPGSDGVSGDMLTVYGEIGTVDRGPVQPDTEPLFMRYGMEFESACVFNWSSLDRLQQHVIEAAFPLEGEYHRFSGPLLRDVLAIANIRGDTLLVTALDGYQREIAASRTRDHDVILALRLDGQPLPIGGLGPAMLVWPRGTDPALTGMNDDDWLWGVFAIEVVSAPPA